MKSGFWIRTLRRTPKWVIFVVFAALYAAFLLGQDLLTGEAIRPGHVAGAAFTGLVVAAVTVWLNRWKSARDSKKASGSFTATSFERAMSTGQVPKDAAPEQWVPALHKAVRMDRHMAWGGPLLFGGFTALGISLTIQNPEHPWFWVLATVSFASIAVWYPIWVSRRRVKLQGLITQFPRDDEYIRDGR